MRSLSYKILNDYQQNNTFLNLALKNIDREKYPVSQIALRVYGVMQNYELLDYYTRELVGNQKIDNRVKLILKMQIYEYLFLEKEKYIVCSEGVKLSKVYCKSASGFINAVLRNVDQLDGLQPHFKNEEKNISIKYSHPRFITKTLIDQYPDDYQQIMQSNTVKKTTYVRKINDFSRPEDFTEVTPFADIFQYNSSGIVTHEDYLKNNLLIQDLGSFLVGKLVAGKTEDIVLDMCAAPGNKSMQIAKDVDCVVALDLHPHRVKLIEDNARLHQIENIYPLAVDSGDYQQVLSALETKQLPLKYDKILLDAPCSGWGVIKSKPEIKYNHSQSDIDQVIQTAKAIFQVAMEFLKPDGQIVYSTCTLNRWENDYFAKEMIAEYNLREVVDSKLVKFTNSDFETGICLKNYEYNSDSFYMIKMERDEHI